MTNFRSMYEVKRHNRQNGYHFFDPSSMRFFNSRIQNDPPYKGRYFVTSEKFDYKSPRYYTIREIKEDGTIKTVGEFQGFASSRQAKAYMKKNL